MIEAAVICLALTILHESRGEPIDGQFAVAQTVLNRAERKPERVCEVVQARAQFSWTLKPPPIADVAAFRQSQIVARLSFYMTDFTDGATHFHSILCAPGRERECKPYWRTDMVVTGQWGNHIFYKQKQRK